MQTKLITTDIDEAARLIANGKLVAVPTETVYGLAGNGLDAEAVEKIYEVKGRPAIKPLALMVPDSGEMERYCLEVPEAAKKLAEKFWPGPLSIVLKARDSVPEIVRAGGSTVALRCPDHPLTLELLRRAKLPLAAPSANPSGSPSPKNAQQVMAYFDGMISAVIDGGDCGIGTESTMIDMSQTPYRILREAALPEAEIRRALTENLRIIGITGGSGCGKTTLLTELERRGALVIDCDEVYHRLLSENAELISELDAAFPGTVRDGALDRKKLGGVVFRDAEALARLNDITHRHVIAEVLRLLGDHAMSGGRLAAVDAIALLESGMAGLCDMTVGLISGREDRIERISRRDGVSREYAAMRVDAQPDNGYYEKNCTHVLENTGTEAEFILKVNEFLNEVL